MYVGNGEIKFEKVDRTRPNRALDARQNKSSLIIKLES